MQVIQFSFGKLLFVCTFFISFTGAVKDATGSFQTAFTLMGFVTILAGFFYSLEPIGRKFEARKAVKPHIKVHNPIYKPCTNSQY